MAVDEIITITIFTLLIITLSTLRYNDLRNIRKEHDEQRIVFEALEEISDAHFEIIVKHYKAYKLTVAYVIDPTDGTILFHHLFIRKMNTPEEKTKTLIQEALRQTRPNLIRTNPEGN